MRGAALLLLAPLLVGAAAAVPAPAQSPVVRTDHGAVRGVAMGKGAAFRGIPFAAPPIGPLRWAEARSLRPWRGVRDATRFGAACTQPSRGEGAALPQSEDCLTLNVVTPDRKGRGLPVLVSIHGGAFAFGSGRYVADQDLSPLVRRGVVLVSPNYRVGRMGFLAHLALTTEAGHGTGNFWLSDLVAALRWVRANVAGFGGDPARVTILGCSAGGSAVNELMASPAARGLFARASAHSGGGFFNASRSLVRAEQEGQAFAARAGVSGTGKAALSALRALSPQAVLAADPGPPDYGAIEDGQLLPEPVSRSFAMGGQARVPLIVGSTSNEASVFGLMGFDAKVLQSRFNVDAAALRPLYERDGRLPDAELLRRIQTDFIFTSAALGMAGLSARSAPTWAYHFDFVPKEYRAEWPGAPHCADMPYLLGLTRTGDPEEAALSARMQDYFFSFIATGSPNGRGSASWPAVQPGRISPMVFGTSDRVVVDFQSDRMAFWWDRWGRENALSLRP